VIPRTVADSWGAMAPLARLPSNIYISNIKSAGRKDWANIELPKTQTMLFMELYQSLTNTMPTSAQN